MLSGFRRMGATPTAVSTKDQVVYIHWRFVQENFLPRDATHCTQSAIMPQ